MNVKHFRIKHNCNFISLYLGKLRYQASIALQGFFLVPSTFTYKKSPKNVKSIKNVIISNLISLYKHLLKIKDSFRFSNMKLIPLKMMSHLTSHNFQILKFEIFSKLCKI